MRRLAATFLLAFSLAACDDSTGVVRGMTGVETAIVVNSIDLSVTVFPVDSPDAARTIGLAPAGSPVSVAARGDLALVPLGSFPAVAVVGLTTDEVRTIALPDNSGATGVAFLNDSVAYVANPNRNSVSVIDVSSGSAGAEIPVGVFPQAVLVADGRAFVLNAELDANFQPARPGRITVIDTAGNAVVEEIELSGLNPSAAAIGPGGLLYVINSGAFGQANGSLSVVDPNTLAEIAHHVGFGEFPGDIVFSTAGRAYVSSFDFGIAVWDAFSDSFIAPPSDPLVVEGHGISSGVGVDAGGRLYTLTPGDCVEPSVALRLDPDGLFDREIEVGVCPIAITFADVEAQ